LTAGIVVLHAVEHHCPFHSGLIAERYVRVLVCDFEESFADGAPVGLGKLGKFPDDFCCAHAGNLVAITGIVIRQIHFSTPSSFSTRATFAGPTARTRAVLLAGLKAHDMTAWGEAPGNCSKTNPSAQLSVEG
jgi:hypothetical protein